ncbi:hypothetical protein CCB81_05475 [Armatimonadetes bacterium Uphvl-Ar2]|nr:hypothetical protein CCB81_05475 [Armatimonadetes bacterium Uphvl-Ar2]
MEIIYVPGFPTLAYIIIEYMTSKVLCHPVRSILVGYYCVDKEACEQWPTSGVSKFKSID